MRCRLEENISYEEAETILINQGIARPAYEVVWKGSKKGESEIETNAPTLTEVAVIQTSEEHTLYQLKPDNCLTDSITDYSLTCWI